MAVVETTMVALTSLAVAVDTSGAGGGEAVDNTVGGGGSYNIGSNQSNTQGGNAGNGQVVIDKL